MRARVSAVSGAFLLVALPALAAGQEKAAQDKTAQPPAANRPAADAKAAIQRGLKFLETQQQDDGHWVFEREVTPQGQSARMQEDPAFNLGVTALAALAMIENGMPPSDPAIQRAYRYIKDEAATNKRTYNLSLTIQFLTRLGSREDRGLIHRLARRLMMGQFDSGGWPYECPVDADRETGRSTLQGFTRKAGIGDNSNTQFAVLGLWAATRAGVQVDEALELVAKRFRGSQAATGGWDYQSTGKGEGKAMTCAGVYGLAVATAAASRKAGADAAGASGQAALEKDEEFQKRLKRVEHFANGIGPGESPYFLWSVERLAVTLELARIGQVDWYDKGLKALLQTQKTDGSWEIAHKGTPDTAFALLFLRKAHLGRDVSYALTGDASKPFVLLGKEKQQGFAKLAEAMAAAESGDTIEVFGKGPFDIAGLHCGDKTLTIRGGEGFEPTLVHKVGLLQDPKREPDVRFGLGVKGGSLTLEGLRLQTDPSTRDKVAWAAVAVEGGELRALNCSFTQSNSAPDAGVELRGGATAVLQNCLIVGFSAAVDAATSADQELQLENCLIYSPVGLRGAGGGAAQPSGTLAVRLSRNTFHVGEVVSLGGLAAPAEFNTQRNIFHTGTFSNQLHPAGNPAIRKWEGQDNVFDLTRWLFVGGQPLRDVRDLDSWRTYWKTKEQGSITRAAPFAVHRQLGPFRHTTNPNDWRLTTERLSPDQAPEVQFGCDVYLVGAGQPYAQFKESPAYTAWRGDEPVTIVTAAGGDADSIQGTWLPTEAEFAGQKLAADDLKGMKLVLDGDKYSVQVGDTTEQGTIKLDPTKTPKTMDITGTDGPNKGKTFPSIYELDGDTLKVCYGLDGSTRPAEFATKEGTQHFLVTYQREKP